MHHNILHPNFIKNAYCYKQRIKDIESSNYKVKYITHFKIWIFYFSLLQKEYLQGPFNLYKVSRQTNQVDFYSETYLHDVWCYIYVIHILFTYLFMMYDVHCTYSTQSNIVMQPKEIYLRLTMFNILLLSRVCTRHGRNFGGNGIKMRYSNSVFYVYLRNDSDFEVNFLELRQYQTLLCKILLYTSTVLENSPQFRDNLFR